jgi:hypothetical protein
VSNDPETSLSRRFVDSLNIRPGAFGMNIDLKKLFTRQKK